MELSKTAFVILGMLRMGKRTGYEIKALVDVSTRHFWAASYGQIYPELKRLEEAGLIEGQAAETGERRRREYELTASGERALHDWLTAGPPLHVELRHEGVLRFFFSAPLDPGEQVELLRSIRSEHATVRGELEAIRPAAETLEGEGNPPLSVLEWGIAYQDFVINWCSETERRIIEQTASGQRS